MSEYSCLNWGYNGEIGTLNRKSKDDNWFFFYDQITRVPYSWKKECIETAKLIRDNTDLPIEIFLSGGVDSVCCCESFREAGIPFEAITIDFDHNQHDIKYSIDYCKYYGIKQNIIKIDIKEFFEKSLIEYADYTQTRNPQMVFQAWMVDQSQGFPIFGLGEVFLCTGRSKNSKFKGYPQAPFNGGKVLTFEGEQYQAAEKMLRVRGRKGINKFFIHTPELKVSALLIPELIGWIKTAKKRQQQDTDSYDPEIKSNYRGVLCRMYFPNAGYRPPIDYIRFKGTPKKITRNDYTGFEYISEMHRVYQEQLFNRYPEEYTQFYWHPFLDKLKMLCGNKMDDILNKLENEIKGF